jgi:histone deacetylase 11
MEEQSAARKFKTGCRLLNLAALICLTLLVWSVTRCIPPQSFRATKEPRSGRAIGERVAIVYSKHYQMNMAGAERLHAFDINKYAKIYLALNTDGYIRPEDVFVPQHVSDEDILLVHTPQFLASLNDSKAVSRYLEAPLAGIAPSILLDAGVLSAFRSATGGTVLAGRLALKYGIAVNLAGGYHHAKPDAGEGFCVYADMAIAIRVLQREGFIKRALVVDLDVHQGNGTAVCFAGDDDVFTFSMHEADIYPIPKETSDLDVELPAGTGDADYLRILAAHLPTVIDKARPDIVFFQAGCDVLAGDPLARLELNPEGIVKRDSMVIDECVARELPVVMVLGGGYNEQAWEVQYASIRRILEEHAPADAPRYPPRPPSVKESLYTR